MPAVYICMSPFFRFTEANSTKHLQELEAKVAELERSVTEKAAEIAKLQADKAGLEVVLERERKNSISSISSDCKKVHHCFIRSYAYPLLHSDYAKHPIDIVQTCSNCSQFDN